ncbi:MAG TPA: alkaline phosphatase family protein, partial [Opitutaceae bacterium]|nr:alkaline phosphatase family protein [Opitutaceae bacterium]
MAIPLDVVKTIVVLMQENRSFDHMLGYLSLPPWNRSDVDGLKTDPAWLAAVANPYNGKNYAPFPLKNSAQMLPGDPPHDRAHIATQLGPGPDFPMKGFVQSCPALDPAAQQPVVMGYFTGDQLPTTDFFAKNYSVCDRWFSSLPTSTQPNRIMLMAGASKIDDNRDTLPAQELVYDWLEAKRIRWRVYHQGIPFFALMPQWIPRILLDDNFRDFSRLVADVQNEDDKTFSQVIFIEPRFTDSPHVETPTDDHAPSALSSGQAFMAQVYSALVSNKDRWQGTVLVIMYDEHGGFFDHVRPPPAATSAPANEYPAFSSLGVRVPGFVVSPLVEPGAVFHGVLDHTSVLKFIADKFTPGQPYSDAVGQRPVASVTDVLTRTSPRADIPLPGSARAGYSSGARPADPTPLGFQK